MTEHPTIAIVGSGAAGAQAALQVLEEGFSVTLLDYGNDDPQTASLIPDAPFSAIRSSDAEQRRYLVGDPDLLEMEEIRVGAHLTPPRDFITRDVDRLLPFQSETFHPMQSLALGGLAAGWGAGAYTFEDRELREAGLPPGDLRTYYEAVARDVGISGAIEDDNAKFALQISTVGPPLEVDTNARAILNTYRRNDARLRGKGFHLGRAPVAMLSAERTVPDETRKPNPYFDMDFYGDSRRSVYRPKYTIERLLGHPRFTYISRALVERFQEDGDGVTIVFRSNGGETRSSVRASQLLLAANAINSARIVLRSFGMIHVRVPILSNPYHYIPCVNLSMLGRAADDRRHSLAQLFAIYAPPHRTWERVTAAFYSYRALLLHRLVKEMPLPAPLGLLTARALLTSFTIVGVHHPDSPARNKWLELRQDGASHVMHGEYQPTDQEKALIRLDLAGVKRALRMLHCVPLTAIDPGYGSSIHYAGTLPSREGSSPVGTDARGKVNGTKYVYAADSSGWNYLPAKGLTFTIMANARRVASQACKDLRESAGA